MAEKQKQSTFLDRVFGRDILRERISDKELEIQRLVVENRELRDRLFIKNALPISGQSLTSSPGEAIPTWKSKATRLRDFLNLQTPLTAPALTDEEISELRERSQ